MHDTGNDDAGAEGNTLCEFAKYFSVDHGVGLGGLCVSLGLTGLLRFGRNKEKKDRMVNSYGQK